MTSRFLQHLAVLLIGLVVLFADGPARASALAIVGIEQGSAVLIRQSSKYALAEGVALNEGDIVETAAGAYAQIEFADGAVVGMGEGTRLILKPRLTKLKTTEAPHLYLLQGWLKAISPTKATEAFGMLAPGLEVDIRSGSMVVWVQSESGAVFVEKGGGRLIPREGAQTAVGLKGGDFATLASDSDTALVSDHLAPDFLTKMPRPFRDRLPTRAARFENSVVTLKALGAVDYADVAPWLHSESGLRLALSRQWRGRASDRAFRGEVAANLRAHMEWERVIFPERFLPKRPPVPARSLAPAEAASAALHP